MAASRQPKTDYALARERLIGYIQQHELAVGASLPGLNRLHRLLEVGRISMQRAIRDLAEEGVLETVPGKGTFVRKLPSSSREGDLVPWDVYRWSNESTGKRKVRMGVLSELPLLRGWYDELVSGHQRQHPEIEIELVEVRECQDLEAHLASFDLDIFQVPLLHLDTYVERGYIFDTAEIGDLSVDTSEWYGGVRELLRKGDATLGVPLATSIVCHYINTAHPQPLTGEDGAGDLLAWCQAAEEAAGDLPDGVAAAGLNVHQLYQLAMLLGVDNGRSMQEMLHHPSKAEAEALHRLEPYYRNPRIFYRTGAVGYPERFEPFLRGQTLSIMGSSSWLDRFDEHRELLWQVVPALVLPGGRGHINSHVAVISSATPYPEECRDLLNWIGSQEMQCRYASLGRLTANRVANRCYTRRDPTRSLHGVFDAALEVGICGRSPEPRLSDFENNLVWQEMVRWQEGEISVEQMQSNIARKARFFSRAQAIRQQAATAESVSL